MATQTLTSFRFDGTNVAAQNAAKQHAAKLVTRVSKGTKEAIRMLIVQSIRDGMSPYDTARQIRTLVGMSRPQAISAMIFRKGLAEQGLAIAKIEKAMERFVAKKIRQRAISIARTETMNALNRGLAQSWLQARKEGLLEKNQQVEILVSVDDRVCPICEPLDGMFVDMDAFNEQPGYHVMCRCTIGVAVPKLGVQRIAADKPTPSAQPVSAFPGGWPKGNIQVRDLSSKEFKSIDDAIGQLGKAIQSKHKGVLWNDAIADSKNMLGYFDPKTRMVHFSTKTTKNFRKAIRKGPGKGNTDDWQSVRTVMHEMTHSKSKMWNATHKLSSSEIALEEGLVEIQARALANDYVFGQGGFITKKGVSSLLQVHTWALEASASYNVEVGWINSLHRKFGSQWVDDLWNSKLRLETVRPDLKQWLTNRLATYESGFNHEAAAIVKQIKGSPFSMLKSGLMDTLGELTSGLSSSKQTAELIKVLTKNGVKDFGIKQASKLTVKALAQELKAEIAKKTPKVSFQDGKLTFKKAKSKLLEVKSKQKIINDAVAKAQVAADEFPIPDNLIRKGINKKSAQHIESAKHFSKWAKNTSRDELRSFRAYTTSSDRFNKPLRGRGSKTLVTERFGAPLSSSEMHINMMNAIADAPKPPPPSVVYRGVSAGAGGKTKNVKQLFTNMKPGESISLDGYTSTTPNAAKAMEFGETLLEIRPTSGVYLAESHTIYTGASYEYEFLIPHGRSFRFVGIKNVTYVSKNGIRVTKRVIQLIEERSPFKRLTSKLDVAKKKVSGAAELKIAKEKAKELSEKGLLNTGDQELLNNLFKGQSKIGNTFTHDLPTTGTDLWKNVPQFLKDAKFKQTTLFDTVEDNLQFIKGHPNPQFIMDNLVAKIIKKAKLPIKGDQKIHLERWVKYITKANEDINFHSLMSKLAAGVEEVGVVIHPLKKVKIFGKTSNLSSADQKLLQALTGGESKIGSKFIKKLPKTEAELWDNIPQFIKKAKHGKDTLDGVPGAEITKKEFMGKIDTFSTHFQAGHKTAAMEADFTPELIKEFAAELADDFGLVFKGDQALFLETYIRHMVQSIVKDSALKKLVFKAGKSIY